MGGKTEEPNCCNYFPNRRFGFGLKDGFLLALLFFSVAFLFPSLSFAQVVINEILPNPVGEHKGNEWIELFNTDITGIDVSGYKLKDAADNEQIINSGFLPPKSWLIIRSEGKFALNNSGSETIYLYDDLAKDPVSSFTYVGSTEGKSWGRIPDGGEVFGDVLIPTEGTTNQTPTPEPTVVPTQAPTSTPTAAPTQTAAPAKATVQINQPKDGGGSELIGVLKIYLDDNYTGNYAPETYTFCDNCQCGTNKISCGFGEHTLKVEKTGYEPWEKTITISAGNSYEETPILALETVTLTPSSTPTLKASPVIKTPIPSASPKTEEVLASESANEVLGIESQISLTPTPAAESSAGKSKIISLAFVLFGLSFLAVSAYSYLKRRNPTDEKESESEENH